MNFESKDCNFNIDFKTLTAKYGREYIAYCQAAWVANVGVLTEEEFCTINNIPKSFFDKMINSEINKYESKNIL